MFKFQSNLRLPARRKAEMTTVYPNNSVLSDSDTTCLERPLTIAQRLAQRERFFLEGPANLSERETRKSIAYDSAGERHQARYN